MSGDMSASDSAAESSGMWSGTYYNQFFYSPAAPEEGY